LDVLDDWIEDVNTHKDLRTPILTVLHRLIDLRMKYVQVATTIIPGLVVKQCTCMSQINVALHDALTWLVETMLALIGLVKSSNLMQKSQRRQLDKISNTITTQCGDVAKALQIPIVSQKSMFAFWPFRAEKDSNLQFACELLQQAVQKLNVQTGNPIVLNGSDWKNACKNGQRFEAHFFFSDIVFQKQRPHSR
jgi:hypothetical protein